MSHKSNHQEKQIAQLLKTTDSFTQIAKELSLPVEQVEAVCFSLCQSHPEEYSYNRYLTKEWLTEKAKDHSIFAIANITGLNYRQMQYRLGKFGIKTTRGDAVSLPGEAMLRRLYLDERMTDRDIAEKYGVKVTAVKNARYKYGIMKSERVPLEEILTIDFAHRLYVVLDTSVQQICDLFCTSRVTVNPIFDTYREADGPLAQDIRRHRPGRRNTALFSRLLDAVPHSELVEELKKKDLYEIAFDHKLLGSEDNRLIPFTKDWFLVELQTKSPTKIALETGKSYASISEMLDKLDIDRTKQREKIGPPILRRLFLELYWSDTDIAAQFGVPAYSVREQRLAEGILAEHRIPLEERLPVRLFKKLYLHEGLSLHQLCKAFRVSDANIRALKNKYVEQGHHDLASKRVAGVSMERFNFLQNQIVLGVYEV